MMMASRIPTFLLGGRLSQRLGRSVIGRSEAPCSPTDRRTIRHAHPLLPHADGQHECMPVARGTV